MPEKLLKYVVRDPFSDDRTRYRPANPALGALAFLFGDGGSAAKHKVNTMHRIIRDFMHRGVVTCGVGATAAEVARIMLDNDVSALVVIDERLNACGIISKTDLIGFYGKDLSLITAEDIMKPNILTVSPATLVHEAAQLMLERRIHQLVIVTEAGAHRRPVGIFTTGDVIALMADKSVPQSEAQMRCRDCLRRLLSISPNSRNENIK